MGNEPKPITNSTMRELKHYTTPLNIGEVNEYVMTHECSAETRAIIESEAKKRGLVTIYTEWTSPTFYFVDPNPAPYQKGFEHIDTFFDWCNDNHLFSEYESSTHLMFGHRHDNLFQLMKGQPLKVDTGWRDNDKKIWKGKDDAIYCYGYTYWHFYKKNPHATISKKNAVALLQEYLDFLHEVNPNRYDKKTVKLVTGKYAYQDPTTPPTERIVVYYGDGKRGSFDYDIAYGSAEIYLNDNVVVFRDDNHGYDLEISGLFNVQGQPVQEKRAC